jgi:hypothetical protein
MRAHANQCILAPRKETEGVTRQRPSILRKLITNSARSVWAKVGPTRDVSGTSGFPSIAIKQRTSRDVGTRPNSEVAGHSDSSRCQSVKQGLGLLKVERIEALGEPAVDRSEKIAGLLMLALIALEPRYTHRRAELPGF